jgi:hypothetical protein
MATYFAAHRQDQVRKAGCLLVALCLACTNVSLGDDRSAWQRAYDPATRKRFIPVQLWTGAPWDGVHENRMAPVAIQFGLRKDKSITGPTIWNGIPVYGRLNSGKLQRFATGTTRRALGECSTRDTRNSAAAAK